MSHQLLQVLLMLQALSCLQAHLNGPRHQPAHWQQRQQQLMQLQRQICLSAGHPTTLQNTCAARSGAAWGGVSCGCWAQQLQWQLRISAVPAAMLRRLGPRCLQLPLLQGLLQLLVLLWWLPFLTAGWAQHPAVCWQGSVGRQGGKHWPHAPAITAVLSNAQHAQHMLPVTMSCAQGARCQVMLLPAACRPPSPTSLRALLCTTACSTRLQDWSFSLLYAPCSRHTHRVVRRCRTFCLHLVPL